VPLFIGDEARVCVVVPPSHPLQFELLLALALLLLIWPCAKHHLRDRQQIVRAIKGLVWMCQCSESASAAAGAGGSAAHLAMPQE
jgi:hypothetical protein